VAPTQTAAVKQPEPMPAPVQSPNTAQPLALKPLVALGEVILSSDLQGGSPKQKTATADPYSSGASFQLNGKALQVTQALTGADARLAVVSDPSDRARFLVLLRLNDPSNPTSTRDYLCAGGTWRSTDLDSLFGISGMVAPPCEGGIEFAGNDNAPRLILNQVKVPFRMGSAPPATVTAYLDASLGAWPFYSYADTYGLFVESGLPPFGTLEISGTNGRISQNIYTQGTEPAMKTVTLADGQKLEISPVVTDDGGTAMTLVRLANTPEQFLLYMAPDAQTTASCRASNMSDEKATLILRELALMGGYATVAPAGAVDVCVGASYSPSSGRLRLTDTVLTHKSRSVRNPITITVTTQATVQANLKLAH
jgi:hypothetical protein